MAIHLPEFIDCFQIIDLVLRTENEVLKLELIDPIKPDQCYKLEMKGLLHFSFSKDLNVNDGCFQLGKFELKKIDDISSLEKDLKELAINTEFYKGKSFYYLDIEGDICLKVLSINFSLDLAD